MPPRFTKQFISTILTLALGLASCALPIPASSGSGTPTAASTPEAPTSTPVPAIATVNGEVIALTEYQAEIARYLSAQTALGKTVSNEDAAKIVLDELISETLLAQAARTEGLLVTESALQSRIDALVATLGGADKLSAWQSAHGYTDESFRVALKRSAEAALMRDKIIAGVPPTTEQVHARQILFYNESEARGVLDEIRSGVSFDEIAFLYDPATRGELGWFPRGYLLEPAIEDAAFALQPGQVSDVIQTSIGFHIIMLVERGEHALSPDALYTLQQSALQNWLTQQRAQSQIVLTP